jgi:mono/diheme cytochrome c family protein
MFLIRLRFKVEISFTHMKKIIKIALSLLALVIVSLASVIGYGFYRFEQLSKELHPLHPELARIVIPTSAEAVALGKRIYAVRSGCIDCHGPDLAGVPIMEDEAMGFIYGANITPFKTHQRTDAELARAIRYGINHEGRSLRAMPSFDYEGLSESDLSALIAYLRSVPSVEKSDRENRFGPVSKLLSAFGKLPLLFPARFIDQTKGFADKPAEGPTAEFGQYLVQSCTGCHGAQLTGGPIPGGDPKWPAASNIRMGKNSGWTAESFHRMIESGVGSNGAAIRPPMPVIALQQMDPTERAAIWQYLSTLDR